MVRFINYTIFAFELNHLIDRGEKLSFQEVSDHIKDGSLFDWLKKDHGVDVSIITNADRKEMLEFFESLYANVDSGRKFGVENEGLNLLLAYCIEWFQENRPDKLD